jgi:hypothetical protein
MTRPEDYDFDPEEPSPLEALRRLRADARDSVVAVGAQTAGQALVYVPSTVDDAITEMASTDPLPHAIFVTGSAGGGKSGAAEYQRQSNPGLFGDIVEDATHSDGPSSDQAETLARRLAPLSDAAADRPERPVLVAANIGMILQLSATWRTRGLGFDALTRKLFSSLGLPGAPKEPSGVLPLDVQVINLDDRPTSGPSGLLRGMLPMLQPAGTGTVFNDTRCRSCDAIAYCPARANAALLSTVAAPAVDELAKRAAIDRGRQDTPRALWDYLSRAALPDSHYGQSGDPCLASQQAHREQNAWWVLTALLPVTIFNVCSDLGVRIARLDPARQPRREAYEAFARAGLLPDDDAAPMVELLNRAGEEGSEESALATAAAVLAVGAAEGVEEFDWRDNAARTSLGVSILLGRIAPEDAEEERVFLDALDVYRRWQEREAAGEDASPLVDEMEERLGRVVDDLAGGLARLFGERLDGRTFLPVQNYDPREPSRSFVEFQLDTSSAQPILDRPTCANPRGSSMVGYRPLAIALELEQGIAVDIDLPTYRLLALARGGLASGSGDAERTFALRRTAETIARAVADSESVPMIVTDPASNRRYQVTVLRGIGDRLNLRARAVSE